MSPIACGCNKGVTQGRPATVQPATYRVIVSGRQVYESSNQVAAETVAGRFDGAKILAPGETS